jgi:hypothetical protein
MASKRTTAKRTKRPLAVLSAPGRIKAVVNRIAKIDQSHNLTRK